MISVFYRSHLFLCPLGTFIVVVMYMHIYVFFKFFECFTLSSINLVFHVTEERFGWSIIETVSLSGHGLDTTHLQKLFGVIRMGIMKSLIRLDICSPEFIIHVLGFKSLKCLLYHI
jgi:hypothetical protein